MKALLLALFIAFPAYAMVWTKAQPTPKAVIVSAAATNIPVAYDTTSGSQVFTGLKNLYYSHIAIFNNTSTKLGFATANALVTPTVSQGYCAANAFCFYDDYKLLDGFYIRSEGSAITTLSVDLVVW